MSNVPVSVALGVVAALIANPTVWTAKLDGKDGSKISGTARVETVAPTPAPTDSAMPPAGSSTAELKVTVTVNNAAPNSSLSWSLNTGDCDDKGAEVKPVGGASGTIKVDASGAGTATAQVKGTMPMSDEHHVAINEGGKVAACGDLEAAKTSTD